MIPGEIKLSLKVITVKLLSHPRVVGVRYSRYLSRAERWHLSTKYALVAQLANALDLGSRFCGFESLLEYYMALWCRRVAHRSVTAEVEGSSPFRVAKFPMLKL